jgi:hypothetical protein
VSMYSQLLLAALEVEESSEGEPTARRTLVDLLRCRRQLEGGEWIHAGIERVPDTLTKQLAYDVTLIKLARILGIECDADEFDRPETGRTRLEAILSTPGVSLNEIETQVEDGRQDVVEA